MTTLLAPAPTAWSTPPLGRVNALPGVAQQVSRAPFEVPDNRASRRIMAVAHALAARSCWPAFWAAVQKVLIQLADPTFTAGTMAGDQAFDAGLTDAETGTDQPKRQGQPAGEAPGPTSPATTVTITPTRGAPRLPTLGATPT
jgi:hypothetical protein